MYNNDSVFFLFGSDYNIFEGKKKNLFARKSLNKCDNCIKNVKFSNIDIRLV